MKEQYNIIYYGPSGDVCSTEGPISLDAAIVRVSNCMETNQHSYKKHQLALSLKKGEQVGDMKGWRYKITVLRPVPGLLALELESVLDEINGIIGQIDAIARIHLKGGASDKLSDVAKALESLVNRIRERIDVKLVKTF